MQDRTETLFLRRALGRARPDYYVDWALDQLCHGADGSNLRVLAGLSARFDRDEIERYFHLACRELGVTEVGPITSPLETVRLIRPAYDLGDVPPAEAVQLMANVYQSSEHPEELLAPWHDMLEE